MLLLWVVISAGLLAVALVLNNSGHKACIRSTGTVCSSIPQHADAPHVMNLRLLAEAFLARTAGMAAQSFSWTDKRT